jgi:formate hydrogenlyase subunit 3/multisubunit Na+/H+ antiporter MnhD subunit
MGLVPAVAAACGTVGGTLRIPWCVPGGAFSLALDALAGLFLTPVLLVCGLAALYGFAYLATLTPAKRRGIWLFYNTLVASMVVVITARNSVLFLVAWEIMALTSFFLVVVDHERAAVREAGWTYLAATHVGTALLCGCFVLAARHTGGFEWCDAGGLGVGSAAGAGLIFACAVVGFGTKAGFVPLHVWLPEAHPAAPSHVSAVMSGVMIKTGIYGIVRVITWFGSPPQWWGWLLVGIGAVSGVLGVFYALAQHDLKRLLAYSSVENIGIIALGLGLGLLGQAVGSPMLMVAGYAGALLHVVNHAMFKSVLFLGAGAVAHAVGTRELDRLGGLFKRMPATGIAFLIGAAAICGLPPLNGFVSEVMMYIGAFSGAAHAPVHTAVACAFAIASLALISGLAAACFAKAFGIVFLGAPRSTPAAQAHEVSGAMRVPMAALAALCLLIGVAAPAALAMVLPAVQYVAGVALDAPRQSAQELARLLMGIAGGTWLLIAATLLVVLLRRALLARRTVTATVTWDCGYARPTARMQYTASGFTQPFIEPLARVTGTERHAQLPTTLFPTTARYATHTPDTFRARVFTPLLRAGIRMAQPLQRLQHGNVQLYILYIAVTLIVLLLFFI